MWAKTTMLESTIYSGTPLIRSSMGQKNLAVSTGDRINKGFFYKKMYGHFAEGPKKSDRNINELAVRQGFTVVSLIVSLFIGSIQEIIEICW